MNDIQPSTPIERAAYIMAKLSAGQKLSTAKVAEDCGVTRQGAYRIMDVMSRVVPLVLDDGQWGLLSTADINKHETD